MNALPLAVALVLAAVPLMLVPAADAAGICTSFTDARCGHLACYGYSWSYGDPYYTCQHYIDYPCRYCMPLAPAAHAAQTACVDLGPNDCGGYWICHADRLHGGWRCYPCPLENTNGCNVIPEGLP